MLGKTMAINSSSISADDNKVILFPQCPLQTMKICLGISLELRRYNAIPNEFMAYLDVIGRYLHRWHAKS